MSHNSGRKKGGGGSSRDSSKMGGSRGGGGGGGGGGGHYPPAPAPPPAPSSKDVKLPLHLDWSGVGGDTVYIGPPPPRLALQSATSFKGATRLLPVSSSSSSGLSPTASEFMPRDQSFEASSVELAATSKGGGLGGSSSSAASTVVVDTSRGLKFTCSTCGRRVKPQFCCCYGKCKELKGKKPSKPVIQYCSENSSEWRVCAERNSPKNPLVCESETTRLIDAKLVEWFLRFKKEKIADLKMMPHSTSPWLPRASDLTDTGSLFECFQLSPRTLAPQYDGPASIGSILHEYLTIGCQGGELGSEWTDVKSKSIILDPDDLNFRIHGSPDAMFRGLPVEFKTIDTFQSITSKLSSWLKQISVYQLLHNRCKAYLVVCSRETFQIQTFEVSPQNVDVSLDFWRQVFGQNPVLRECLAISRQYAEHCEALKKEPEKMAQDSSFFEIEAKGVDIFSRFALTSVAEFEAAILNKRIEDIDIDKCVTAVLHLKKAIKILESSRRMGEGSFVKLTISPLKKRLKEIAKIGSAIGEDLFAKAEPIYMDPDDIKAKTGETFISKSLSLMGACEDHTSQIVRERRLHFKKLKLERFSMFGTRITEDLVFSEEDNEGSAIVLAEQLSSLEM